MDVEVGGEAAKVDEMAGAQQPSAEPTPEIAVLKLELRPSPEPSRHAVQGLPGRRQVGGGGGRRLEASGWRWRTECCFYFRLCLRSSWLRLYIGRFISEPGVRELHALCIPCVG